MKATICITYKKLYIAYTFSLLQFSILSKVISVMSLVLIWHQDISQFPGVAFLCLFYKSCYSNCSNELSCFVCRPHEFVLTVIIATNYQCFALELARCKIKHFLVVSFPRLQEPNLMSCFAYTSIKFKCDVTHYLLCF